MNPVDLAVQPSDAPVLPRRRKRLILGTGVLLFIVFGVAWCGLLYYVSDRRLNLAIAEADRLDPGWRLAELEAKRPVLPDEENAAVRVLAARKLVPAQWPAWDHTTDGRDPADDQQRAALQESFRTLEPPVLLNAAQVQALRTELPKGAAALAEAYNLTEMTRGRFTIAWTPDYIGTLVPHVQQVRELVSILDYDALLRMHDKDLEGALRSCRAALHPGRSLGEEPLLISQLVRIACDVAALRK